MGIIDGEVKRACYFHAQRHLVIHHDPMMSTFSGLIGSDCVQGVEGLGFLEWTRPSLAGSSGVRDGAAGGNADREVPSFTLQLCS